MDTARIHFVGLVFLTTFNPYTQFLQTPDRVALSSQNQAHVIAIMPRVPYTPMLQRTKSAKVRPSTSVISPTTSVDPHVAALVFEPSALIGNPIGWQKQSSGPPLNYDYIVLNGEQITFVADAATGLPDRLTTGKLQSRVGQLTADYQPPFAGAAAVFHLSQGLMHPCSSITTDNLGTTITRYDTVLDLDNHGTITIKSTDGSKSATFHGNANIAAANAPLAWLQSHTPSQGSVPHYKVYCQMIGIGTDDTSCPASVLGAPSLPQGDDGKCKDAMEIIIHPDGGGHGTTKTTAKQQKTHNENVVQSSDLFCSTTSWP
jgi:hypothetical protein